MLHIKKHPYLWRYIYSVFLGNSCQLFSITTFAGFKWESETELANSLMVRSSDKWMKFKWILTTLPYSISVCLFVCLSVYMVDYPTFYRHKLSSWFMYLASCLPSRNSLDEIRDFYYLCLWSLKCDLFLIADCRLDWDYIHSTCI